jgi:hypothetical protein
LSVIVIVVAKQCCLLAVCMQEHGDGDGRRASHDCICFGTKQQQQQQQQQCIGGKGMLDRVLARWSFTFLFAQRLKRPTITTTTTKWSVARKRNKHLLFLDDDSSVFIVSLNGCL